MSAQRWPDEPLVDDGSGRLVFAAPAPARDEPEPRDGRQYAVLVVDPQTGEVDVYGPLDGTAALVDAARRREEHDRADLEDVLIQVARLQAPAALRTRTA